MLINELKKIVNDKNETVSQNAQEFFERNKEKFKRVFINAASNNEYKVTCEDLFGRTAIDNKIIDKLKYIICTEFGVYYSYGSYFYGWGSV